jgi:hypothetical protein
LELIPGNIAFQGNDIALPARMPHSFLFTRAFKEEFNRLLEHQTRFLDGAAFAGNVQPGTQRDVSVPLPFYHCRKVDGSHCGFPVLW